MEPADGLIAVLPVDAVLIVLDVEPVDGMMDCSFVVDARALAEAKVMLFGRSTKDILLLALLYLFLAIRISLVTPVGSSTCTCGGDLSDSTWIHIPNIYEREGEVAPPFNTSCTREANSVESIVFCYIYFVGLSVFCVIRSGFQWWK